MCLCMAGLGLHMEKLFKKARVFSLFLVPVDCSEVRPAEGGGAEVLD